GNFTFTILATDAVGAIFSRTFTISISAALAITTTSPLPGGDVGLSYLHSITATGGKPPYTWSISSGAPPSGISLNAIGTLFGIPSSAGGFSFTVQVTDSSQATASATFSLTVAPQLVITTSSPLPRATVASYYNRTLAGAGGTPPYSWPISGGA